MFAVFLSQPAQTDFSYTRDQSSWSGSVSQRQKFISLRLLQFLPGHLAPVRVCLAPDLATGLHRCAVGGARGLSSRLLI
jgi:hypothetical protein